MTELKRCNWPGSDKLMMKYHDEEWGMPNHDDRKWFEYITLDAFQAGLSWAIVLKKRENFRNAFDNFDPKKIVKYDQVKVDELIQDAGIIRNKLKINATISNAKIFLDVQKEFGTFDKYIWQFVSGKPIVNQWKTIAELPASTSESDNLSTDLKNRGFKFVGTTICYAFMQSAGMVNDHLVHCFRYKELTSNVKRDD
jgi:DNA-3-methyladenine glycosylase I